MSEDARRELAEIKTQLTALMDRVRELERRIALESRSGAQSSPSPQRSTEPPLRVPPPSGSPQAQGHEIQSLERALGGKVALYTGISLIFLAMAFFLGWAWTRLTPEGRLALGYLGGFALLGLGSAARSRSESWFVDGLLGAGLATLYLTHWAGWERYQLFSFALAFGLTTATTLLGVGLALWQRSETMAVVATIGGFAAPVWLRGDGSQNAPLNFFGYLAALNAGMLAVAAWREWRWQQTTCLIATVILLWGWSLTGYKTEFRLLTLGFISLYYVLFALAFLLPDLLRRRPTNEGSLILFVVSSLLYLPVGYGLSREAWGDYPGAFLALAGLVYLAASWGYRYTGDLPAAVGFFTLGLVCTVGAVAVQFQPHVQVVLYSLGASGLVTMGLRFHSRLYYGFGIALTLAAAVMLWSVVSEPIRAPYVLLNEHGVAWLASLLAGSITLHVLYHDILTQPSAAVDSLFPRQALAIMGAFGVVIGLAWFSAEQTLYAFELNGFKNAPAAHLLVSLEWTLLGTALLVGGVQQAIRALRLMGLGMLALTTSKLFLYDLGFLQMPYRAFSFAGLGLALIGVAWLYSRLERAQADNPRGGQASPS
ncbi:MAG: hypothetical protein CFK49_11170 [Armatimonadetes bacterium JP3_11]|jgi:uncharacterized membrane protein|nr:MAG: hypothetical protein CFK48_05835 [Armatimonadetes bacterium CP1_7O]OYT71649.1 MAG: hypothetical protein CFK49_11170 [Armatimonadetes bacterium JP3_11]RMH08796.1 MAG: DUF2339 domain-containing protein [Armatimonadota bacterium]